MKKSIVVLAIGALFLAALSGGVQKTAWAAEAKTLKYGLVVYLTGPASTWGIPVSRGILLGAHKINEKGGFKVGGNTYKWEVIICDSKYIPAEAVKCTNKQLYDDKVSFMNVGGGSCVLAANSLLKEAKMLSLNTAGGGKTVTNPGNPLLFRYNPAIESMYAAIFPFIIKNHGVKTMAAVNPDDETGRSGLEAVTPIAGINKLQIITKEFFERGTKEFSPLLTRVIAKNPDMIETGYTDPTSSALIVKQARELGYKGIVLLAWAPDPKQVLGMAGRNAEGAYMAVAGPVEPQTPEQKEVYNRYLKYFPARDWDPTAWAHTENIPCLTKAIEATQSFDSFKLAAHLENMSWDSPFGTLSFGGSKIFGIKRQLLFPMTLLQVREGKAVYVGTPPVPAGIVD
jgi:branched-chain amino acid transport system substrate-binding protein